MTIKEQIIQAQILVVIPTYNNEKTIAKVISDVKQYSDSILIVNDGSTDSTSNILSTIENIEIISYIPNKGKGYAIRQAIKYAADNGYKYILTLDSDGQHYAENIIDFVGAEKQYPNSLIVGSRNIQAENMPGKNTFANKFSNFWFKVIAGTKMSDTQSGFRLYPVQMLSKFNFITNRYEFEVEVLVRAAWSEVKVMNIPIKVYYPPQGERVSHFKPLKDFTRISILNTCLFTIALIYFYPKLFFKWLSFSNIKKALKDNITNSNDSNFQLAASIGLGVFFGIFPIWGYQMIVGAFTAHLLKLNKAVTLIFSNISIPPCIPFIIYGSYLIGGLLLSQDFVPTLNDINLQTIWVDIKQYLIGAVALSIIAGCVSALVSYLLMLLFKRKPANG